MIRKLRDLPWPGKQGPCRHKEHELPILISLKPGVYEHVCPGCGDKHEFTVGGVEMSV